MNILTIVTKISSGKECSLRRLLRTEADPAYDRRKFLRCRPKFKFHEIPGLHFCSFVILSGDEEFAPYLVFEATFDGLKEDFINALLQIAGTGIDDVYQHCVGYPVSALVLPNIVAEYLLDHDVGANAFFSGCPGRPVGQIIAEHRLRGDMVAFFEKMRRWGAETGTVHSVRERLQSEVICHRPLREWAEQAAAVPDAVAFGRRRLVLGALALSCILSLATAFALWLMFGLTASEVYCKVSQWYEYTSSPDALIRQCRPHPPSAQFQPDAAARATLIAMLGLWFALRFTELVVVPLSEDPSERNFLRWYARRVVLVLRYAVLIFLIGFGIVALGPVAPALLDKVKGVTKVDLGFGTSWWRTVGALASCAVFLALLRYAATSLKLLVEFQQLSLRKENLRLFLVDFLGLGMLLGIWMAAIVLVALLPTHFVVSVMGYVAPLVEGGLVVAFYVLVTCLFFLFFLIPIAACVIRVLELRDRRRYTSAHHLQKCSYRNASTYAREEVGINAHQNHLASITRVKPGLLRYWMLAGSLCAVNLLARLWFNRGDLGGIPTILSARWVMIDNGRRLLFLDNYGGAWESYLNQFIDLAAVIGLNAIWTNTFLSICPGSMQIGFPDTKFLLWGGAQAEKPFKAYVRQSQVETMVWYSAYPTLSITNINTNTEIRQALFKPSTSSELDAFFGKL